MQDQSDIQLLHDYAATGSETAFRELVTRHTDFVFSAALRQVESPDLAADLAQGVFTDLARKARPVAEKMPTTSSLAGWLHRSTRYAALNHLRDTRRRQSNERLAMEQLLTNTGSDPDWELIRSTLDEALDSLDDEDREALLLRYFKNQDYHTIGVALGTSDNTAQKRVARAVEKLREFFTLRKVTIGAGSLITLIAANSIQAAPAGLTIAITTTALAGATVTTTASTVIAATKTIAMTTLQKALVTATVAVLAGTGIYEARQAARLRDQNQSLLQQQAPLNGQLSQLQKEYGDATNQLAALRAETARLKSEPNPNQGELLRLRGEVTKLKLAENDPTQKAVKAVAAKINQLKQRLELNPKWKIPELQFITEKDWAAAVWDADLDTEDGVREALSKARETAINRFLNEMMKSALKKYLTANKGILPATLSKLASYFDEPVTDAMLGRYKLLQTGKPDNHASLVKLTANADEDYDSFHQISINGASGGRFNHNRDAINDAAREFARANNFQAPTDPAQIAPYLRQQIDDATVQKYLKQFVVDPPSPEEQVMAPVLSAYSKAHAGIRPDKVSDLLPYATTPEQQAVVEKIGKNSP